MHAASPLMYRNVRTFIDLYWMDASAGDDPETWALKAELWSPESTRIRYVNVTDPPPRVIKLIETWELESADPTRHGMAW